MLNFRNTNILFGLLIAGMIAYDFNDHLAWYWYLLAFIIYSLVLFYGSAYVDSDFYIKVLSSEKTPSGKTIAISFDDGPADNYTNSFLDILARQQVPAAFFCIGKNIAGREETLKRIDSEGHLIANHSYSHHFWFDMYGSRKMSEDLALMNAEVQRVTGLTPKIFRPPYGVTNPNLAKAIRRQGLTPVGWNIRSMDTVEKDPAKLMDKLLKSVKPGSIVLFHDTSETTFRILDAFIEKLKQQGFEFVRLDKMLNIAPYA